MSNKLRHLSSRLRDNDDGKKQPFDRRRFNMALFLDGMIVGLFLGILISFGLNLIRMLIDVRICFSDINCTVGQAMNMITSNRFISLNDLSVYLTGVVSLYMAKRSVFNSKRK
jgi:hypothetical protein